MSADSQRKHRAGSSCSAAWLPVSRARHRSTRQRHIPMDHRCGDATVVRRHPSHPGQLQPNDPPLLRAGPPGSHQLGHAAHPRPQDDQSAGPRPASATAPPGLTAPVPARTAPLQRVECGWHRAFARSSDLAWPRPKSRANLCLTPSHPSVTIARTSAFPASADRVAISNVTPSCRDPRITLNGSITPCPPPVLGIMSTAAAKPRSSTWT